MQKSRRDFIKVSAAVGAGYFVSGSSLKAAPKSPNEKLRFACIGIEGKGGSDTNDASNHGDIVAICDVDESFLDKAADKWEDAKRYYDFRKCLEEMQGKIDAVTISTPDHTHAPAAAMAMKMGLHVYCQKPLTHTIYEARKLAEIARETKVATQMGNQGTAGSMLRRSAAAVRAGAVGNVKEVHVWTNRPIWPQGGGRPKPEPVPATLHWNEWLGPAQMRDYGLGYHPFKWRGYWEFGTGALGDMACHTFNMPFMALDLRDPTSVVANTSGHNKETFPSKSKIKFEFPGNDKRGPVTVYWYDGGNLPAKELFHGEEQSGSGSMIIGDNGTMYTPSDYAENQPKLLGGGKELEKVEFKKSPGHFEEWIRAIRGGEAAMSNFPDYGGPLTETILLGNLAVWADGKTIEWDSKNMKALNAPEVEPIIRSVYREGYSL